MLQFATGAEEIVKALAHVGGPAMRVVVHAGRRVDAGAAPVAVPHALQPVTGQPDKPLHAGARAVLASPVAVAARGAFLVIARDAHPPGVALAREVNAIAVVGTIVGATFLPAIFALPTGVAGTSAVDTTDRVATALKPVFPQRARRGGAPIPAPTGFADAARHGPAGFFVEDGDALPVPAARFGAHGCRAIFAAPTFRAIASTRRLIAIAPRRTIVRANNGTGPVQLVLADVALVTLVARARAIGVVARAVHPAILRAGHNGTIRPDKSGETSTDSGPQTQSIATTQQGAGDAHPDLPRRNAKDGAVRQGPGQRNGLFFLQFRGRHVQFQQTL